ncbi:hypothetical protein [Thalassobacillus sp. C254]|uniref:hypothetical protein n=1 Tax=Thalassobacillus sp. C254 TaxID=1225341 RepID=UPI0012ED6681|nr:hypothetical protein [Thalassobacillus sp. C254]
MELAMPFLKKGLPVFVDKPLSLIPTELQLLKPYLLTGQLMSCSAMRYAKELDEVRNNIHAYGELPVIRGIGPNLWETYGIHLLEAIVSTTDIEATSVLSLNAAHSSIVIQTETEGVVHIDTVESVKGAKGYSLPFQVDFWGTKMHTSVNIKDNFSMFRRMLWHFFHSISTGKPAINSNETLHILKTLIAGRISKLQNRKVYIHEVNI